LRQDIATLEDTLPELQKVGYELAANSGNRSGGIAGDLLSLENSVTEVPFAVWN
jgi:hypothetical protein